MNRPETRAAAAAVLAMLTLLLAGCHSSSGNTSSQASAARSGIASLTADPTVSAEAAQAEVLVKACFAGTPLQQLHQVHLVFLSSVTGKNGTAVVAARSKVFGCLGIPEARRDDFKNAAITAAEHQTPAILSAHPAAGVRQYLEVTLPQLVLKYKGLSAASPAPSPGQVSAPAASVTATASPA